MVSRLRWMVTRWRPSGRWGRVTARWWLLGGAIAGAAGLVTWIAWPSAAPERTWPRYREFTACQLTGEGGVQEATAKPMWDGITAAASSTRARAQFLAVAGPQTPENAKAFLNSLATGRCDIIFAAGNAQIGAVTANAGLFPQVRFYVVGTTVTQPNVTTVDAESPQAIRDAVTAIVTDAARGKD